MAKVKNQCGKCGGAEAPQPQGVWQSSPGRKCTIIEECLVERGKAVITRRLQAALFHPILSKIPEKALGKTRRKHARMSTEVVAGQWEYRSFSFFSLLSNFVSFF
jgi:hypothetical protein